MKKEQDKTEVPNVPDRLLANIRSYFTKEINEKIAAISPKEMEYILKSIVSTPYWIAILKYTGMRMPFMDAVLRGTDPTKEPSSISWAQGAMAGLCDLESYVIDLNSEKPIAEEDKEGRAPGQVEGVIVG